MFLRAKLVPRRVRTEACFRAADPWNGGAPAEFSIETYYYVPEHVRVVTCPWRWGSTPIHGLRSGIDGVERFLPDALSHLWKIGKVAAEALPGLLREIEPDLAQTDFQPMLGAPMNQWMTVALTLLLVAMAGLLLSWPSGGGKEIPWLAGLCGAVVAGGILGALYLFPSYFARRSRRRRQMEWATQGGLREEKGT
jgi:hypothetical protein